MLSTALAALNIAPIELCVGNHGHQMRHGRGCIMNVISYLAGEDVITDRPACVAPTVRGVAILLNDVLDDAPRQRLLGYVERLMRSRASDAVERARAKAVIEFARRCVADLSPAMARSFMSMQAEAMLLDAYHLFNLGELAEAARHACKAAYSARDAMRNPLREQELFELLDHVLDMAPLAEDTTDADELIARVQALGAVHDERFTHDNMSETVWLVPSMFEALVVKTTRTVAQAAAMKLNGLSELYARATKPVVPLQEVNAASVELALDTAT